MALNLSDRDKRTLAGGGLVIAVLLAYLLFWSGEPEAPPAQEPPTQAVTAPPPPQVPQPAPVAPSADASQLRLHGVMGGGAIIAMADGSQRYIPLGREVLPGLVLKRLEVHHAVLESGETEIRLGFDGVADAQAGATAPVAVQPAPAQPAAR